MKLQCLGLGLPLAFSLLLAMSSACSADTKNTSTKPPIAPSTAPPAGTKNATTGPERLHQMTKFYGAMNSVGYSVTASQVISEGKNKRSRSVLYEIKVNKPLSLAVDVDRGKNQNKTLGRLNQNDFAVFEPTKGYVKQPASSVPEGLRLMSDLAFLTSKDTTLFGFMGTVCSTDPMHVLSFCKLFKPENVKLINSEKIDGVQAQHLNLISEAKLGINWDIWVEEGAKPWLRRTETHLKGRKPGEEVLLSTDFSNWQDNPKYPAAAFIFVPPPGAKPMAMTKQASPDSPAFKLEGKDAPLFSLHTVDGGTFNLADSKGKEIVVLDFWATWCGPCRASLPLVAQAAKAMSGQGVRLCAIDLNEDPKAVAQFLKANGLDIKAAIDPDGHVCSAYGVQGIPQTVVIGKDGKVKFVHIGGNPNMKNVLTEELKLVLAGKK